MKMNQEELDRRAAVADRARLALRRATLELLAAKGELLEQHKLRQHEDRSSRPDSRADRGKSSA